MFIPFFLNLREAKLPVSLTEFLTLMEGLKTGQTQYDVEAFYYLARASLVKDERFIDRFDKVFAESFKGVEGIGAGDEELNSQPIPDEWLRKLAEKHLSAEEMAEVEALGGWDKLMETLKQRLEEQKGRHQGGNKWIGTAGTSPFGAYGYNPEGVRIGQNESRHRRAVKVWDKREFKDFDDSVELGTRNIKIALKRLRRWVRQGAAEELDLDGTIRSTAHNGYLDVQTAPERHNAAKVLLFMDVGGSMDEHVKVAEELFSAARTEFKNLEYFYFHNCLYEGVWKDNKRRWNDQMETLEVLRTYGSDYKVIFVGDASMSPYEIVYPGGANEHWNAEPGEVWLRRVRDHFPSAIWLNPVNQDYWKYTQSVEMIRQLFEGRMFPLTLSGLTQAMKTLG